MAITLTTVAGGYLVAEGHGHQDPDLRIAVAKHLTAKHGFIDAEAADIAGRIRFQTTWYDDDLAFTHDCAGHSEEEALPTCGKARPVTEVVGVPRGNP